MSEADHPSDTNLSSIGSRMRDDWNARAREDAGYYVAFGRRDQDDAGFFATATEVVNSLESELRRVPAAQRGSWRALEIGCGPGRLMRPMSRHFAEIHGVDVSDEMVALGREKLRDIGHAHVHTTDGARLTQFPDEWFDFVYSYAVFQHIPAQEVILEYMREIHRVLKPGGFARLQFNGLPQGESSYDTWSGARFTAGDLLEFTERHEMQVLALEGAFTQYMWTTWRKRPAGWHAEQQRRALAEDAVRIRRITNSSSSEPLAPCRGRFASVALWVERLPPEAGLHELRVMVGDSRGTVTYIGAADNVGLQQISVILPELEATGLLPVELRWLEQRIAPPCTLRVIPPGPSVPCVRSVTDGVNLVARRIETRSVKLVLEEIARPHEIAASVSGKPVTDLEFFCTDPRPQRFEVNFRLPEEVEAGKHDLQVSVGNRRLAPISLEVV
jgi:SAM-dependent methyltransferase